VLFSDLNSDILSLLFRSHKYFLPRLNGWPMESFNIDKRRNTSNKGNVLRHRNLYGTVIQSMGNDTWNARTIQRRFDMFDVLLVGKRA